MRRQVSGVRSQMSGKSSASGQKARQRSYFGRLPVCALDFLRPETRDLRPDTRYLLFITSVTFPAPCIRSTLDPCPRNQSCAGSSAPNANNPKCAAGARSSVCFASRRWAFVSAPMACSIARPAAPRATTIRWIGKARRRTTSTPSRKFAS